MSRKPTATVLRFLHKLVAVRDAQGCLDRDLLNRFVNGRNEDAFAALVERHGPLVLRVCQRVLHDRHTAEDAFQATFLVLARKAGTIRRPELLANWLYGVASRISLQARADAARTRAAALPTEVASHSNLTAEASAREVSAILDEELRRLPGRLRTALLLCYVEGLTRDQVAGQLGWSLRTLTRRLERGREILRRRLARRGVTMSAALLAAALGTEVATAVPPLLAVSAIKAALAFGAGNATAAAISPAACTLAQGVLHISGKKGTTVAVFVLILFLGTGVGLKSYWGQSVRGGSNPMEAKSEVRAVEVTEPAKEAGDIRPHVLELLREALQALKPSAPEKGDDLLRMMGEVAVLQGQLGDAEAARETFAQFKKLADANPKPYRLFILARSHAELGQVDEARKIMDAIRSTSAATYPHWLYSITLTLARAGKLKEALAWSKDLPAESAGNSGGSRSGPYPPRNIRDHLLAEAALARARAGDLKDAWRTWDSISDPGRKVRVLVDDPRLPGIAILQEQAGDRVGARQTLAKALRLAEQIKDSEHQAGVLADIVDAQARFGDLVGAADTLAKIPATLRAYKYALIALSQAQAAAGQGKAALQAIAKLRPLALRVRGYYRVAIGQARSRDLSGAQASFEKAWDIIETIPDTPVQRGGGFGGGFGGEPSRKELLRSLAAARAAAKDFKGALETAAETPILHATMAYGAIAEEQAKAGDMKGALKTLTDAKTRLARDFPTSEQVSGFGTRSNRPSLDMSVRNVARVLAERGNDREALVWARQLPAPERGYALLGIVEGIIKGNKLAIGVGSP